MKSVVADRSIGLEYSDELGGAEGKSSGGRITLRTGLLPAEEFSTLAHELAHEMLHHSDNGDRPTETVDHIVPLAMGGANKLANLQSF